ncbi:DivIVA domain-containing protein [Nonomuraea maritima]|nr:DivIVA domain-containing protein [Nonomuraea maritima]
MRSGYDPVEVDALVGRIESTLGRGPHVLEPVTADEVRRATFRAKRGGYQEIAVDFALEAFVVALETQARRPVRLAMAEPTGDMIREEWFETQAARVERVAFRAGRWGAGYNEDEVDAFLDRIVATLRGTTEYPVTALEVREAKFSTVVVRSGYLVVDVDAFLSDIADVLEQRHREPSGAELLAQRFREQSGAHLLAQRFRDPNPAVASQTFRDPNPAVASQGFRDPNPSVASQRFREPNRAAVASQRLPEPSAADDTNVPGLWFRREPQR